jgi:transposase-like protein
MPGRKYTDQQRDQALAAYIEHGACEAARRTGIPQVTISTWARRGGVQSSAPAKIEAAVKAGAMKWAQRRVTLADKLGQVSEVLADAAQKAADAGDGRNAQALMTGAAIGVDKAELLTGRATSRSVTYTDPVARAKELADVRDELEERRQQRETG